MQKTLTGLGQLETNIHRDFEYLNFPPSNWVKQKPDPDGRPMLDVLIVGGGMCGMAANLALRRVGISNIRTIDASPSGFEGPWLTFARMETLRSPKHLTGPALGLPNLTFRAWYEAQYGRAAWDKLGLIPRAQWADYLRWFRRVTGVEVENGKTLRDLQLGEGCMRAIVTCRTKGSSETILARRIVLATGRDALARPRIPQPFAPHMGQVVFHTSDAPSPSLFRGNTVAIVGLAASAFDYAAEALEAGAERVTMLGRSDRIPRINKAKQIVYRGFTHGFASLPDEKRFEIFRYISSLGVPPPRDTVRRVTRHENFELVLGAEVEAVERNGGSLDMKTKVGSFGAQVVVLGTGFTIDVASTPFLKSLNGNIVVWGDRMRGHDAPELRGFPYLGSGFEFQPRSSFGRDLSAIERLHCFNHAAMVSLGNLANDIPSVSEGAQHLANEIAARFFLEDSNAHRADLEAYVEPELLGDEIPQVPKW